jgi:maltose O-acetyltransferase
MSKLQRVRKLWQVLREELAGLHPRLFVVRLLLAPLPVHVGSRLRIRGLRLAGFQIGQGTVMWGLPLITGNRDLYHRLTIGRGCWINLGCCFDLGDTITVGDGVAFGHQVLVMTTTHVIGPRGRRAADPVTKPVKIDNGAWIGARCTILPGVTVGAGAIVAAGAVVTRDVPPNTIVAGVPARVIKELQ